MRISNASSRTLTISATLAMLAACSGASSQLSPAAVGQISGAATQSADQPALGKSRFINAILAQRRSGVQVHGVTTPSFFSPAAKSKPLVFVSDSTANVVNIFLQRGANKMVGQITGLNFPVGLTIDAQRNLYVANASGSDVLVYAPSYTKAPKLTLDDTGELPVGVAVSPQGLVAVVNACAAPSCPPPYYSSVTFYSKNATTPCATVSDPSKIPFMGGGGAFDDKGNFFTDGYNNSSVALIGEITGGCNAKAIKLLTTGNTISVALEIRVDKADRIALLQGYDGHQEIDAYRAPQSGSLGNPVVICPVTGIPGEPAEGSFDFAFLTSGRDIYTVTSYEVSSQPGVLLEYGYPAGGTYEKIRALPAPEMPGGLALAPALLP